jgi:hypothetical protein
MTKLHNEKEMIRLLSVLMLIAIISMSLTVQGDLAFAGSHHHSTSSGSTIQATTVGESGKDTGNATVITTMSDVGAIPGFAPNQGITVGTVLEGCNGVVSNSSDSSLKPRCDLVVRYVVNYCLAHMNDTMAQESKQVCWDHDTMESGLKYAVTYLDGGTGMMLKAQSDIMATISNAVTSANAGLSKEALSNKCLTELEAKTGIHFTPDQRKSMLANSTSLEKLCSG